MKTYKIIRFYAPGNPNTSHTVKTGLTLKQAQAHCRRKDTREEGVWFDGYNEEGPEKEFRDERQLLRLSKYTEVLAKIN